MFKVSWLSRALFRHPVGKAAGVVLNALAGSILGGWWLIELSIPGRGVDWARWNDTWATAAITIYIVIVVTYTSMLYYFETRQYR